jgi:hypothetical protein
MVRLTLVSDAAQIASSHQRFVNHAAGEAVMALGIIRRTQYWIFDPKDRSFSPSKFSGYAAMDFARYDAAREHGSSGATFDGGLTQRTISAILGDYQVDPELSAELDVWVERRFGAGSLEGINRRKWRFARLSDASSGGLVGLAGGWEGSEELVEAIAALPRNGARSIPDLD